MFETRDAQGRSCSLCTTAADTLRPGQKRDQQSHSKHRRHTYTHNVTVGLTLSDRYKDMVALQSHPLQWI